MPARVDPGQGGTVGPHPVKVTVVVPVYNPGRYIDDCITSLLRQTMPASEFEVVFVDDGSTDDTPQRLDDLAAQHHHIHVIHQENSGWPGRPRNVGIDTARGEYVFLADADDWLGEDALRRMYTCADEHQADVLVPRSVGHRRNVPRELFATGLTATTLRDSPQLTTAMTAHKLLRRAFLVEHGIRFPEGRRRLEDHLFMIEAYLRARRICVLAGYPCYHHIGRTDGRNISRTPYRPDEYFGSVRTVLDRIDAHVEPGPLRDRLYHRWYNVELLGRLDGEAFLRRSDEFQRRSFAEGRRLSQERFDPRLVERFGPGRRVRALLVRDADLATYRRFLAHDRAIRARARLISLDRGPDGRLEMELAGSVERPGEPFLEPDRDGPAYALPGDIARHLPPGATTLTTGKDGVTIRDGRVLVALRERETGAAHFVSDTGTVTWDRLRGRLTFRAAAVVDPRGAGGGPLPDGTWDVRVRVEAGGWSRQARVEVPGSVGLPSTGPRAGEEGGRENAGPGIAAERGPDTRLVIRTTGLDSLAPTHSPSTSRGTRRMSVKVSVIVPVYNPGSYIEDLIASLLRQTLPAEEFEAIFVDDGSTDETPARLDRMMAEHPHLRVIHQENSGWPGRPRNVGIDNARGEYVFFCDNDDWLGDEALARMYDFAVANRADVLIPKMAGIGRGVPRELFRRTRPSATLENAPLIDSLTPHKLFRKAFLDEHGLRFPEGRRRLEDHVFVTAAYFAAERICVLSDYVCYYHIRREDVGNAGFQPIEPRGYFANLSEALDIVLANTEPGKLRDKLFRRWLRVEMVERLRGRRFLLLDPPNRQALFDEIKRVVSEYFAPSVAAGLAPAQRIVVALVEAGRLDALEQLAEWEVRIGSTARLERLEWDADGGLNLSVKAALRAGEEPVSFVHREGHDLLLPRLSSASLEAIPEPAQDSTKRLAKSKIDVLVRHRTTRTEFFLPTTFEAQRVPVGQDGSDENGAAESGAAENGAAENGSAESTDGEAFTLEWTGTARLDPQRISGDEPLTDGLWDVMVRVNCTGWVKDARLAAPRDQADPAIRTMPAVLGESPRLVTPYRTEGHENLAIDVGQTLRSLNRELLNPAERPIVRTEGDDLVLEVPLRALVVGAALPRLVLAKGEERVEVDAALKPGDAAASGNVSESGTLTGTVSRARLAAGAWRLRVRFSGAEGRAAELPLRLVIPSGEGDPRLQPVPVKRRGAEPEPDQERRRRFVPSAPPRSQGLAASLYRVARRIRRRLRRATAR